MQLEPSGSSKKQGASFGLFVHLIQLLGNFVELTRHSEKITKSNSSVVYPLDIVGFDRLKVTTSEVSKLFGRVDIIILNSGQSQRANWITVDPQVDIACFNVNALGPTILAREYLKNLETDEKGVYPSTQFVVVSSIAGIIPATLSPSYTAAKHAVMGYFRLLALEFSSKGISVSIVCPSLTFAPNNVLMAFSNDISKVNQNRKRGMFEETLEAEKECERDDVWEKYNFKLNGEVLVCPTPAHMSSIRAADLILKSAANKISESWLSKNPIILLMGYANLLVPGITNGIRSNSEIHLEEILTRVFIDPDISVHNKSQKSTCAPPTRRKIDTTDPRNAPLSTNKSTAHEVVVSSPSESNSSVISKKGAPMKLVACKTSEIFKKAITSGVERVKKAEQQQNPKTIGKTSYTLKNKSLIHKENIEESKFKPHLISAVMRLWFCLTIIFFDAQISDALEKNAGIYFRLNQKAVDYITDLASDAMPQILNNMHLPDISVGPATISKIHLNEVKKPNIQAKFVENKGVKANISMPLIRTSAEAAVDMFFPIEAASSLNFIILLLLWNFISAETKFWELILLRSPIVKRNIQTLSYGWKKIPPSPSSRINWRVRCLLITISIYIILQNFVLSSFLVTNVLVTDEVRLDEKQQYRLKYYCLFSLSKEYSLRGYDMVEEQGSRISNMLQDVVFGLDGGILYNDTAAADVDRPRTLNTSVLDKRMIGILLSDYVPNTLFSHIFDNDMGSIHERFEAAHLPKSIRKLGNMLCSKCYLDITAHLTDKPRVEIDDKLGARVELAGNVTVLFHGRQELHDLIHATTRLHITLKPSIRHSRLYGDVSLTSVDVNVFDLGVGGPLAKPIGQLISFAVPRVLWPQVKKRLRFALNKRDSLKLHDGEVKHIFAIN
uniref:BPI2 domain-containing protein n=1 Tax=Heterorhabditis bacteriophora TaxID=37862 RepID=A0A1I7XHT7_HETBA